MEDLMGKMVDGRKEITESFVSSAVDLQESLLEKDKAKLARVDITRSKDKDDEADKEDFVDDEEEQTPEPEEKKKEEPAEEPKKPPVEEEPEDSEEAEEEPSKEYLGSNEDNHFYLVRPDDNDDLQVCNQEGKVVFSASKHDLPTDDVLGFINAAKDNVDIENFSIDVYDKYVVPVVDELQTQQQVADGDIEGAAPEGGAGENPMPDEDELPQMEEPEEELPDEEKGEPEPKAPEEGEGGEKKPGKNKRPKLSKKTKESVNEAGYRAMIRSTYKGDPDELASRVMKILHKHGATNVHGVNNGVAFDIDPENFKDVASVSSVAIDIDSDLPKEVHLTRESVNGEEAKEELLYDDPKISKKAGGIGEPYKPGDTFRSHAGAPGIGWTDYIVTRVDDKGIWGKKKSSNVRVPGPEFYEAVNEDEEFYEDYIDHIIYKAAEAIQSIHRARKRGIGDTAVDEAIAERLQYYLDKGDLYMVPAEAGDYKYYGLLMRGPAAKKVAAQIESILYNAAKKILPQLKGRKVQDVVDTFFQKLHYDFDEDMGGSWYEKKEVENEDKIEAYGVRGMKSKRWRKTFKSQKDFEKWLDKNEGDVEVHGSRKVKESIQDEDMEESTNEEEVNVDAVVREFFNSKSKLARALKGMPINSTTEPILRKIRDLAKKEGTLTEPMVYNALSSKEVDYVYGLEESLQEVKVVFMNRQFDASVVSTEPGITINVSGKRFNFSPQFSENYVDAKGNVSDDDLKELALDALANISDRQFDDLSAHAPHVDKEIEDSVVNEQKCPKCGGEGEPVGRSATCAADTHFTCKKCGHGFDYPMEESKVDEYAYGANGEAEKEEPEEKPKGEMNPDVSFVNAQEMHRKYPDTFAAPEAMKLHNIKPGQWVKVCAEIPHDPDMPMSIAPSERFWVKVNAVQGTTIKGTVDNKLVHGKDFGFALGDSITVEMKNVYDIAESRKIKEIEDSVADEVISNKAFDELARMNKCKPRRSRRPGDDTGTAARVRRATQAHKQGGARAGAKAYAAGNKWAEEAEKAVHDSVNIDEGYFPTVLDQSKIGSYPLLTKAGGGHVWDEVLEYRVWLKTEDMKFPAMMPFATYKEALNFYNELQETRYYDDKMLMSGYPHMAVLILQRGYIDEPDEGIMRYIKKERITEWRPEWLENTKQTPALVKQIMSRGGKTESKEREEDFPWTKELRAKRTRESVFEYSRYEREEREREARENLDMFRALMQNKKMIFMSDEGLAKKGDSIVADTGGIVSGWVYDAGSYVDMVHDHGDVDWWDKVGLKMSEDETEAYFDDERKTTGRDQWQLYYIYELLEQGILRFVHNHKKNTKRLYMFIEQLDDDDDDDDYDDYEEPPGEKGSPAGWESKQNEAEEPKDLTDPADKANIKKAIDKLGGKDKKESKTDESSIGPGVIVQVKDSPELGKGKVVKNVAGSEPAKAVVKWRDGKTTEEELANLTRRTGKKSVYSKESKVTEARGLFLQVEKGQMGPVFGMRKEAILLRIFDDDETADAYADEHGLAGWITAVIPGKKYKKATAEDIERSKRIRQYQERKCELEREFEDEDAEGLERDDIGFKESKTNEISYKKSDEERLKVDPNVLDKEQKDFVCYAVNQFGDDDHPCAEHNNLQFFYLEYVLKVLNKAIPHLNAEGKEFLRVIVDKLKSGFEAAEERKIKERIGFRMDVRGKADEWDDVDFVDFFEDMIGKEFAIGWGMDGRHTFVSEYLFTSPLEVKAALHKLEAYNKKAEAEGTKIVDYDEDINDMVVGDEEDEAEVGEKKVNEYGEGDGDTTGAAEDWLDKHSHSFDMEKDIKGFHGDKILVAYDKNAKKYILVRSEADVPEGSTPVVMYWSAQHNKYVTIPNEGKEMKVNERNWKAEIDLSFLEELLDMDDPDSETIENYTNKIAKALEDFRQSDECKEEWEDEIENFISQFEGTAGDPDEFDYVMADLYDWADAVGVWVAAEPALKKKEEEPEGSPLDNGEMPKERIKEMSQWSRAAQTDEQEEAILELEQSLKAIGHRIRGGTTIGKSPQTVVLDVLKYQGSEVYVDPDGEVTINNVKLYAPDDVEEVKDALLGEETDEQKESKMNEQIEGKTYKGFVRYNSKTKEFDAGEHKTIGDADVYATSAEAEGNMSVSEDIFPVILTIGGSGANTNVIYDTRTNGIAAGEGHSPADRDSITAMLFSNPRDAEEWMDARDKLLPATIRFASKPHESKKKRRKPNVNEVKQMKSTKEQKEKDLLEKKNKVKDLSGQVKDLQADAVAALKDGDYQKTSDIAGRLYNIQQEVGSLNTEIESAEAAPPPEPEGEDEFAEEEAAEAAVEAEEEEEMEEKKDETKEGREPKTYSDPEEKVIADLNEEDNGEEKEEKTEEKKTAESKDEVIDDLIKASGIDEESAKLAREMMESFGYSRKPRKPVAANPVDVIE